MKVISLTCPACGGQLKPGTKTCGFCGVAVEIVDERTARLVHEEAAEYCPICGSANRKVDTFRCTRCGRLDLCKKHAEKEGLCSDCAKDEIGRPAPSPHDLQGGAQPRGSGARLLVGAGVAILIVVGALQWQTSRAREREAQEVARAAAAARAEAEARAAEARALKLLSLAQGLGNDAFLKAVLQGHDLDVLSEMLKERTTGPEFDGTFVLVLDPKLQLAYSSDPRISTTDVASNGAIREALVEGVGGAGSLTVHGSPHLIRAQPMQLGPDILGVVVVGSLGASR